MIKSVGYEGFFGIIGAFVIVAGLTGGSIIKEGAPPPPPETRYWKSIAQSFAPENLRGRKELFVVLSAQALLGVGLQVFFPYLLIYMQHYVSLDPTTSTILMAVVILIGGVAVAVPWGILVDRVGRRPMSIVAVAAEAIGLVLFSVAKSPIALALFGIFWVSAQSLWSISLGAWSKDLLPEDKRGQFTGISLIFTVALPMVIGPIIGSTLIGRFGIPTQIDGKAGFVPTPIIFQVGAAVSLVALWPILRAKGKRREA
jgi:MFS family permease